MQNPALIRALEKQLFIAKRAQKDTQDRIGIFTEQLDIYNKTKEKRAALKLKYPKEPRRWNRAMPTEESYAVPFLKDYLKKATEEVEAIEEFLAKNKD